MQHQIPDGAKVRFHHGRRVEGKHGTFYRHKGQDPQLNSWLEAGLQPAPRGGTTACEITMPDGHTTWGVAECSERDNYCKKIGRDIALGRALKKLQTLEAIEAEIVA